MSTEPNTTQLSLEDVRRIFDRLGVNESFTIELLAGDTAYDPETGDTLLGSPSGIRVTYRWGEFPGPSRVAIVEPLIG